MPLEPHLTIEIEGTEELIARLRGTDRELTGPRMVEGWERMVEMVASTAREHAPHDLGYLVASILEEVIQEEDEVFGVVFSDEFYAAFQERGSDPYFPNLEALEEWAERHGTTAWVVAIAIATRGLIAHKFFEKGITENRYEILELVGNVVAEIMEREY